ncbi:MAG TPA: phosphonate metabolism transcriptional regulator PhnF [Rhodospirillales bacterium]|nr:phosphonate metabolism transcriptional regulator PhnF [Rhodospirillales bacterium]
MTSALLKRNLGNGTVYHQIGEILESEIREFLKSGDSLPSEAGLAVRFGVNRHTIRRAVEELIANGLVERIHGKGIFVIEPPISYEIGKRTRFTERLEAQSRSTCSTVLNKYTIPAQGGVAKQLGLKPGTTVVVFETLREVDGIPFCVISHFILAARFCSLKDEYTGGSLHEFLANALGIQLQRSFSLISAILPNEDDAGILNIPTSFPVLRVKSLNLDAKTGEPVEYAVTRFRGETVELSINP